MRLRLFALLFSGILAASFTVGVSADVAVEKNSVIVLPTNNVPGNDGKYSGIELVRKLQSAWARSNYKERVFIETVTNFSLKNQSKLPTVLIFSFSAVDGGIVGSLKVKHCFSTELEPFQFYRSISLRWISDDKECASLEPVMEELINKFLLGLMGL